MLVVLSPTADDTQRRYVDGHRARIETTLAPSTGQQVLDARYRWIRAVSAFESVAALVQREADRWDEAAGRHEVVAM